MRYLTNKPILATVVLLAGVVVAANPAWAVGRITDGTPPSGIVQNLVPHNSLLEPTGGYTFEQQPLGADPIDIAANINALLIGNTVGYAFVISERGLVARQGQSGFARVPMVDGAGTAFTVNTDVNVYSVSKTITAIAALQLMDKLGLQPDDPISDWLPPSWDPGLGFGADGMSFYDVLSHHTGINQTIALLKTEDASFAELSPNTYDGVKAIVEHGIYPQFADINWGGYGNYSYKNANYKLMAILIWQMALETGDLNSNAELSAEVDSATDYQHYVRENVLQAAGVNGSCYPTAPVTQQALAYDVDLHWHPLMYTQGTSMGSSNGLYNCGPKSWWLSAMDLAAVAAHLQHGNLLSAQRRAQMDGLAMGWSINSDSVSRPNRYWHGGLGKWTNHNRTQLLSPAYLGTPSWQARSVTTKARIHSCLMKLPGEIEATLLINSDISDSSLNACGVLHQAFEDAL